MLTKRIITVLTFNEGVLFRTKLFEPDYRYTLNFVDAWSVDEIVVLDITRTNRGHNPAFFSVIEKFAGRCFVPIAAGGGIQNLEDVKRFLDCGADKVIVNSAALKTPSLISEIANAYGSQCVVVSIDVQKSTDGIYRVYSECGQNPELQTAENWAIEAEQKGAGEILITAMDRDGALQGYDLDLIKIISTSVSIPVLALGGCGSWPHMAELFQKTDISGACTQNIYHFTENSIKSAKTYLASQCVHIRQ